MKAVIFDFDGVIHDTLKDLHKVHCETLEKLTLNEMKEKVFSGNSREYFERFNEEEKNNFEETWKIHYSTLKLNDVIRDELSCLSKEFRLFIISSNTEINLNLYFRNNNFSNIFEKIYGVETHILKVEKFKILLNETNLKIEDCIFVTDTLGDILEANKVGIRTIGVDFGYHNREKLKKGNPFKIVSSFKDIKKIIEKL